MTTYSWKKLKRKDRIAQKWKGKSNQIAWYVNWGLLWLGQIYLRKIEFIHTVFAHTNLTCKTLDPFYKLQQWPFQDLTQSSLLRIIIIQNHWIVSFIVQEFDNLIDCGEFCFTNRLQSMPYLCCQSGSQGATSDDVSLHSFISTGMLLDRILLICFRTKHNDIHTSRWTTS